MRAGPRGGVADDRPSRRWAVATLAAILAGLCFVRPVQAYRPFDGTDGDVAPVGDFALELGPAHYYREGGASYLIAPGGTLNLGLVDRLELVGDFKNFIALGALAPGNQRDQRRDTDLLLKVLLRRGCLQGLTGPSLALEAGALFPDSGTGSRLGSQANAIASVAAGPLLLHFNETIAGNRNHLFEVTSDLILEGWPGDRLHPVAELFVDRVFGGATIDSALLGAMWSYSESVVFDLAGRAASVGGRQAWEVRLGFTWTVRVWGE